jgi:UDP-2-acetamido-3-amino-2,3-dideoxy-glucuronate N-acetyltransferase
MPGFLHPLALCECENVGEGTRIWAFAHVMRGAQVGKDCNIGEGAFVESGAVVGDRVTLKNKVMVWDGVAIGDDAFIGPGVIFTNDKTPRSPRMPLSGRRYNSPVNWLRPTTVGQGASLGAGVVVLPGITIGEFAMVAAGAVVTGNVAPYRLVLGNPARPAGWVCICGTRLDAALACPSCRAGYALANGSIVSKFETPVQE